MGSQLNSFTRLPSVCLLLFAFRGVPFEAKVAMVKESKDGDNIHMTRSVFRLIEIFGIRQGVERKGQAKLRPAAAFHRCPLDRSVLPLPFAACLLQHALCTKFSRCLCHDVYQTRHSPCHD